MNEFKLFTEHHELFGELEMVLDKEGRASFPATDVAKKLGYSNPNDAINRHSRNGGVVFHEVIDSLGRTQLKKFIDEGNLYRLIARSKLPDAEKFESWIFDELLPSIRRDGIYVSDDATDEQKKHHYNMLATTFSKMSAEHVLDEYLACVTFHEQNRTRLPYERKSKTRRSDKLRTIADSKVMILERLLGVLEAKSQAYRPEMRFELKSLVDEVIKIAIVDLKNVKHNQTRGLAGSHQRKLNQVKKAIG